MDLMKAPGFALAMATAMAGTLAAAPARGQGAPVPCLVPAVLGSLAQGDFAKALAEAEPCRGKPAYARLKGQAFHGLYHADSAIHYLRIDLARGKDDAVLVALAEALVWKKETKEAGRLLDQVRDRKTPSYFKAMASWHEAKGKFARAVEMYDKAIAAEKDPSATRFRKALALSWQKQYDASIALYTSLMEKGEGASAPPGFKTRCKVNRAQVIAWKGDLDKASAELVEVLAREPRHSEARLRLGEIREWQGRFKEAKDEYRNVLLSDPENAAAKRKLEEMLWVK